MFGLCQSQGFGLIGAGHYRVVGSLMEGKQSQGKRGKRAMRKESEKIRK